MPTIDNPETADASTGASAGALRRAVRLFARIRREGDWEAAQTHSSLVPYLIEETWELADAIAEGNRAELRSELGDLLLQVLFHAAIAAEDTEDPFDIDDIAQAMLDKLRRRAPYWFEDQPPQLDAATQDRLWQEAKAAEKADNPRTESLFTGISWAQPALALGDKILARCAAAGIPTAAIPAEVRQVSIAGYGVFGDGTSTEASYRATLRRFATAVDTAHRELGDRQPGAQHWREAIATAYAANR